MISIAAIFLGASALISGLGTFVILLYLSSKDPASALDLTQPKYRSKKEKLQYEEVLRKQQKEAQDAKNRAKLHAVQQEEADLQKTLQQEQEQQRQAQTLKKGFDEAVEPTSFKEKLQQGLSQTRSKLSEGLSNLVLGKKEFDESVLDELESLLLSADLGPETTDRILEAIQKQVDREQIKSTEHLKDMITQEITQILKKHEAPALSDQKKPLVLLFVGVNGVGKTTTIGKIASQYRQEGKKVLLGAGDTFRAAAIEQLQEWGRRAQCDVIAKAPGSDPASVMYESVQKAIDEEYDVVICDTAGRLHTKKNLMEELKKMVRVIQKLIPEAPHEVLLVLDATTGQNAIFQTREFSEITDLTGLIVTKLDGTAKGGVVIGIVNEFEIPIKFIGVGESIDSLRPFDPEEFAKNLL